MMETATLEKVEAMYTAFSNERLRWLIGKGDLLVQKGELELEHLQSLIQKTVKDEFERNLILNTLRAGSKTVTQIAKSIEMDSADVFKNIIALTKWKRIEVSGQKGCEYLYTLPEMIAQPQE